MKKNWNVLMKTQSPSEPLEPSYGDYVKSCGVWDVSEWKGKSFRRLKPLHQKYYRDILEAALSRYKKGQAIGQWDLNSIKIRDDRAVLPPASGHCDNLARQLLDLAKAIFGTDGVVPERDSFYKLLAMLTSTRGSESFSLSLESLIFHRLLRSAKENIDFIGNGLEYLKANDVRFDNERWDVLYKAWTSNNKYDIKAICQRNKYLKQVFEYRRYQDSSIHLLQYLKNLFKHVNENRAKVGKAEWSHEELEIIAEFYFPNEMGDFYEFLWAYGCPMNFTKSRLSVDSVPPIVKAFSETPSELATRGIQVIKHSELRFIHEIRQAVHYGKWKGCEVAIKREQGTSDKLGADFEKKVELLNQLNHPNITAFYGVVRDGPEWATVTEYMISGSLKEVLQKKTSNIDHWNKVKIARNAALAFEYIHEKSSEHVSLNSGNFLLDLTDPERPICKIGDLELASFGAHGNEPWMAPELLNGTKKNFLELEKLNVYSFGIVMWEMLTWEKPYENLSSEEIKDRTIDGRRPDIPSWCDPKWRLLMERCWSANPDVRPHFSDIAMELVIMPPVRNIETPELKSFAARCQRACRRSRPPFSDIGKG